MRLKVVTGTDRNMFWQTLILLESAAGLPVQVCDFGLEPAQAAFLRRSGRLLERIDGGLPADRRHVFYLKSALIEFLGRDPGADMVAWVDADALLAPEAGPALMDLARAMAAAGDTVAAASDDGAGFDEFCDRAAGRHPNVEIFRAAFRANGLPGRTEYLNSGVILCRSAFLAAWRDVAFALQMHVILDQNAFNLAARRPGQQLRLLSKPMWNNQGRTLDAVVVADGVARVGAADPSPVQVLHATSSTGNVLRTPVEIRRHGGLAMPTLKLFRDPALQALQTAPLGRAVQAIGPEDGLFPPEPG